MLGPGARRARARRAAARRRAARGGPRRGRGRRGRPATRSPPASTSPGAEAAAALARLERSATSPARWSALYSRTLLPRRRRVPLGCAAARWPTHDPDRSLDRRLGLRRRRRHPGRPEGVRPLRGARDDRDHGDHGAEHGRGRGGRGGLAGDDRRPGPGGRRGHRRRRGQDRDARARRRRSTRWSRRSACVGEAPVVVDPVMVAESGAVLLDEEARAALVERLLPLADGRRPRTSPRRGR